MHGIFFEFLIAVHRLEHLLLYFKPLVCGAAFRFFEVINHMRINLQQPNFASEIFTTVDGRLIK